MEKTTITNQHPLKEEIEKQHPLTTTKPDTKIYAIRTILYAIVAVWLRFFKDTDIDILFKLCPKDIKDNVAFIITLLKQSKKYNVDHDSATKYATESAASILNNNSDDNFSASAKYAASAVAFIASDAAASVAASDAMKAAKSATSAVADARKATVDARKADADAKAKRVVTKYDDIYNEVLLKAYASADARAAEALTVAACVYDNADIYVNDDAIYAALLYLMSAYLYLKI